MQNIIMHVDVNSAFLSWSAALAVENGCKIDYRNIPSIVAGNPRKRHGIVLAKSIPAKRYGIKTADTIYSARQKCPNLKIVAPDYDLYMQCSEVLRQVLARYSPRVERFSIDEYFVDFSGVNTCQAAPFEFATQLKDTIYRELGFTVNIGVSSNKLLAKIAGDFEKPNKVHTLFKSEIATKLWPLPIGELYMVGRKTLPKLTAMGIETVGDLAVVDRTLIASHLKKYGLMLRAIANGEIGGAISGGDKQVVKSIGNSTTIAFDVTTKDEALMILLSLTEMTCMRLRAKSLLASTVAIKIKSADFSKFSHQTTIGAPTDDTSTIFKAVRRLFDDSWDGTAIRLLGVRLTNLSDGQYYQLNIFDYQCAEKRHKLNQTIDHLRQRYGRNSIFRATFSHSGFTPVKGGTADNDSFPTLKTQL